MPYSLPFRRARYRFFLRAPLIPSYAQCRILGKALEGNGKTLEGESPLLKDGALSLQTSLSHRELPPRAPAFAWRKIFFALHGAGVLGGSFLLDQEVQIGYKVRLSRPIGGWKAFGDDVVHERIPHKKERDSRTLQQIHTSQNDKNFPTRPPPPRKANQIFAHVMAGVLWGS